MPIFAILVLLVVIPGALLLILFGKPDHGFVRSQMGVGTPNDLTPGTDLWYATRHHH